MNAPLYHVRLAVIVAAALWFIWQAILPRQHWTIRSLAIAGAGALSWIVWMKV